MFVTLEPRLQDLSNDIIYIPNFGDWERNDNRLKFVCAEIWYMFNLLGITCYKKNLINVRFASLETRLQEHSNDILYARFDNRARNDDYLKFAGIFNI